MSMQCSAVLQLVRCRLYFSLFGCRRVLFNVVHSRIYFFVADYWRKSYLLVSRISNHSSSIPSMLIPDSLRSFAITQGISMSKHTTTLRPLRCSYQILYGPWQSYREINVKTHFNYSTPSLLIPDSLRCFGNHTGNINIKTHFQYRRRNSFDSKF